VPEGPQRKNHVIRLLRCPLGNEHGAFVANFVIVGCVASGRSNGQHAGQQIVVRTPEAVINCEDILQEITGIEATLGERFRFKFRNGKRD